MWEGSKFVILLVMVSMAIVTVDQYIKKGRYWKIWVGASLLACLLFTFISVAGPPEIHISPGIEKMQDSAGPVQESSDRKTSTETRPQNGNNDRQSDTSKPTTEETGKSQPNVGEAENSKSAGGQTDSTHNDANSPDSRKSRTTGVLSKDLLLPVDEASNNPGFKKFRDNFLAAISRKDLAFLKKHLSPNIRYSFGLNKGIDGFLQEWQLNKAPNKSGLWYELSQVLELGGSFDKDMAVFTAPYVFSRFPSNLDGFEYAAVIRDNVSIHSAPDPKSPIIMGLSYKILKLVDSKSYNSTGGTLAGELSTWRRVETPSGAGFINSAYLRSPIDYRAQFRQEDGDWKMVFFVAGD